MVDGKRLAPCFAPPRVAGSYWPYFTDNTALGEVYSKTVEVESEEDWEALLEGPAVPEGITAPPGGFLLLASFQVLWSKSCQTVMPTIEALAPTYPAVRFVTIRADRVGIDTISRKYKIEEVCVCRVGFVWVF